MLVLHWKTSHFPFFTVFHLSRNAKKASIIKNVTMLNMKWINNFFQRLNIWTKAGTSYRPRPIAEFNIKHGYCKFWILNIRRCVHMVVIKETSMWHKCHSLTSDVWPPNKRQECALNEKGSDVMKPAYHR